MEYMTGVGVTDIEALKREGLNPAEVRTPFCQCKLCACGPCSPVCKDSTTDVSHMISRDNNVLHSGTNIMTAPAPGSNHCFGDSSRACAALQVAKLVAEIFAEMTFIYGDVHCDPHQV